MSAPWKLTAAQRNRLDACLDDALQDVPADWVVFSLAGRPLGHMSVERAEAASRHLPFCRLSAGHLDWLVADHVPLERSLLIETAAGKLRDAGAIRGWRDERYACYAQPADCPEPKPELFRLERAAFRYFGLRSQAVHVNGFRHDGRLWIARRAADKAVDPNRLDNLAAGGLPADEMPRTGAVRELWEEDGIPPVLAQQLSPHGILTARRVEADGLHHEDLFMFDLELPDEVTPHNIDGEVAQFYCLTQPEILEAIWSGQFTGDASLVTARFLLDRSAQL